MSKGIIGCDCDGVLIDIGLDWAKYLGSHYSHKDREQMFELIKANKLPYNLTELYNIPEGDTGFEFFDDFTLYDNKMPRKDAVTFIPKILELGYEIVYISKVIGNHFSSKHKFLEKFFPNHSGIIFTDKKELVNVDIMIDDTFAVLNKMPLNVKCIKFRKDYQEDINPSRDYAQMWGWDQVYTELERGEI